MALLLNVIDIDNNGNLKVTDGNNVRVTPARNLFNALISGAAVSMNTFPSIHGLDIGVGDNTLKVYIDLTPQEVKSVRKYISASKKIKQEIKKRRASSEAPRKTALQKEREEKMAKLADEQNKFRELDKERQAKQAELAQNALNAGLINLSNEDRMALRKEYFKNKKLARNS